MGGYIDIVIFEISSQWDTGRCPMVFADVVQRFDDFGYSVFIIGLTHVVPVSGSWWHAGFDVFSKGVSPDQCWLDAVATRRGSDAHLAVNSQINWAEIMTLEEHLCDRHPP